MKDLIADSKNLARVDADQIKPEYSIMNASLVKNLRQVPGQNNEMALPIVKAVRLVNYFFLTVITIMAALLLMNIIVRIEVQHKPVIIQTLVLILFISSLVYFKFHILELGITDIFLI